jgi:hemerythrin-like domain-containing protein
MEHRVFCGFFDQIERIAPGLRSLEEVKLLGQLIEGMLVDHADTENNLAYAALDHVLEDRRHLDRLHHDHHEIDNHFRLVQEAGGLTEARHLLKKGITASRKHFQFEERDVFPLLNSVLESETLCKLGEAWMERPSALAFA